MKVKRRQGCTRASGVQVMRLGGAGLSVPCIRGAGEGTQCAVHLRCRGWGLEGLGLRSRPQTVANRPALREVQGSPSHCPPSPVMQHRTHMDEV